MAAHKSADAVLARHMVRTYDPDRAVPAETITRALDLATRAPSAGFTQGWDFVVLTTDLQRSLFWASTTDPHADPDPWLQGMRTAPVLVLLSFGIGDFPMALVFNGFELAAVLLAVLIAIHVANDGESNWFEGVQLLAVYVVLAIVFFFV